MPTRLLRAALLLAPGDDPDRMWRVCAPVAAASGYLIVTIARSWDDLMTILWADAAADVGIVETHADVGDDKLIIVEDQRRPRPAPDQRRPEWIRRRL